MTLPWIMWFVGASCLVMAITLVTWLANNTERHRKAITVTALLFALAATTIASSCFATGQFH